MIQSELHPTSYKNVPFLGVATSTSGGRKTITHEFVNSNKRHVEDLGLLQKTFAMTGVISGPNYTNKRNALVRALEEGGPGELVHPFFGKVRVVAKPYTITENDAALGEAVFSLVFERSEVNATPQVLGSSIATIDKLADTAQTKISKFIAQSYKVSSQYVRNFVSSETLLGSVATGVTTASKLLTQSSQQINSFADSNRAFTNNIRSLINAPTELGLSVVGLITSLRTLSDTPSEILAALNDLFDFGDSEPSISAINAERVERIKNNDTIRRSIKCLALCNSYREVVKINFTTVTEIDNEQERLNAVYNAIIDDFDSETRASLSDLRSQSRDFLDRQRINAKRIIDVETKEIPAQVLAFNLYGDIDFVDDILELNAVSDISFLSGSVKVFT